jgi:hypothetical protein
VTGNLLLLLVSALFCWSARPSSQKEWSGEKAADFAAGLIIAVAAGGEIFSAATGNDAAGTLLYGLAWYAAFPLVVLVRTIQAAQVMGAGEYCYWDRVIWGRILLVLCVVFELARRSDVAEFIPALSAIIGTVSLLAWSLKPRLFMGQKFLVASLWGVAAFTFLTNRDERFSYEIFKSSVELTYLAVPLAILLYQTSLHHRQQVKK